MKKIEKHDEIRKTLNKTVELVAQQAKQIKSKL
jgi:hypothetical protein